MIKVYGIIMALAILFGASACSSWNGVQDFDDMDLDRKGVSETDIRDGHDGLS